MNKKGFTLIELLIVIAIIGILSTLSFASYSSARSQSRDTKRMVDLKAMDNAFESYLSYNDGSLNGIDISSWESFNTSMFEYLSNSIIKDPAYDDGYHYIVCVDGSSYLLYARLEKTSERVGLKNTSNYSVNECIQDNGNNPDVEITCSDEKEYCLGYKRGDT